MARTKRQKNKGKTFWTTVKKRAIVHKRTGRIWAKIGEKRIILVSIARKAKIHRSKKGGRQTNSHKIYVGTKFG